MGEIKEACGCSGYGIIKRLIKANETSILLERQQGCGINMEYHRARIIPGKPWKEG